jgi:RHS repeat-associated protein
VAAAGTGDNGNASGYTYTDTVNNYAMSHSALYVYDTLNRLVCAQATSPNNNPAATYDLVFSYDRYGNMACSQNANTHGPCPQWAYGDSTNQISTSPCSYDAAGNMTKDCSTVNNHAYQWDAEGRVSAVDPAKSPPPPTWSFTYNALGERVQMVSPGGTQELMYDPNGAWLGIYGALDLLPWGGGYFALYNGTDTYFNRTNNLGSSSMLTNHAGTAVEDALFYPWGQNNWKLWGSGGYSFADLPYYDTTTDTNLTLFRLQSPGLGRWLSPDPLAGDITNPQSLNRYAYVMNNPTTNIDPLGLWCIHGPGVYGGCGGAAGDWGWGSGPFGSSGTLSDSGDSGPGDGSGSTSIVPPFGSGDEGGIGGLGSGPLSGDFGPLGYPSIGGWGQPCGFGTCGGSASGSGFQAAEAVAAPFLWEGIKDLVTAGLAIAAAWQARQSSRITTVTCKCQIIDLTTGTGGAVGYATGVGVGPTYDSAQKAAYGNAVQNAKAKMGNSGFYLRHCQYSQQ